MNTKPQVSPEGPHGQRRRLSHKQQAFIDAYLRSWNATQAAKEAGYSAKTATAIGAENLTKPDIAVEIQRRVSEMSLTANECLTRLAEQARGSMEDFLEFEEVKFDPPRLTEAGNTVSSMVVCTGINMAKAKAAGKLHLIKSVTKTRNGLKVELYDGQRALELIGKAQRLFVDRMEIEVKDIDQLIEAELAHLATGRQDAPAEPPAGTEPGE